MAGRRRTSTRPICKTLITKHGVQVKRTPEAVFKAQLAAWDKVVTEISATRPRARSSRRSSTAKRPGASESASTAINNEADFKSAYEHYFGRDQDLIEREPLSSPGRHELAPAVCIVQKQRREYLRGKSSALYRSPERGRRQGVRLVHRHHDAGHLLRRVRALCVARTDQLGFRRQLFHVRRAVHDGRRLHAVAQRRMCAATSSIGCGRRACRPRSISCSIIIFFFPGFGALLYYGMPYAATVLAYRRSEHLQPDRRAGLSAQDADPDRGGLMLFQCLAEIIRCIICIRDGVWPQRLHDVEEMESRDLGRSGGSSAHRRRDARGGSR